MKVFAIGLALSLPLWAFSQSTTPRPAPQKPSVQQIRPDLVASPPGGNEDEQKMKMEMDREMEENGRHLEPAERGGGRPYRELLNESEHVSSRHFSERDLEPHFLSTLLWEVASARKEEGKYREARGVDVYVLTKEGIFLYDNRRQMLQPIVEGKDARKSILSPENLFAEKAPIILVYVANAKKQTRLPADKKDFYAAMDCGIASQMAYFFCASENLVTTTLEIDPIVVGKVLELKNGDKALLAQPVGVR